MKINLGSGIRLFPRYTNVDIIDPKLVKHSKNSKYVQADIHALPFEKNSVTQAEMYSVIEHIPFREVTDVLKEVYRVLKPKGKLLLKTDDFDGIALDWINLRMQPFDLEKYQFVMETAYGNQAHGGEFHKCCMTTDFLNWALVQAGFKKGTMTKLPKNSPCVRVGGMFPIKKGMVYRNTQILVEAVK